jgi:hypothetical protein
VSVRYLLLAAPPLVVTIGLAVLAGAELSGSHPLTMGAPRSVPEAIALRDEATAARLLEDGAAADEIGLIRAGILTGQPVLATPLEAAVLELSCLARDIGGRAVPRLLANAPACPPGHALQTVLDRP